MPEKPLHWLAVTSYNARFHLWSSSISFLTPLSSHFESEPCILTSSGASHYAEQYFYYQGYYFKVSSIVAPHLNNCWKNTLWNSRTNPAGVWTTVDVTNYLEIEAIFSCYAERFISQTWNPQENVALYETLTARWINNVMWWLILLLKKNGSVNKNEAKQTSWNRCSAVFYSSRNIYIH